MKVRIYKHNDGKISVAMGQIIITHQGEEDVPYKEFNISDDIANAYFKNPQSYTVDFEKGIEVNAELN